MIEFKLDLKSGVPFHRQIVDQIRYGIASGRLLPGDALKPIPPSHPPAPTPAPQTLYVKYCTLTSQTSFG